MTRTRRRAAHAVVVLAVLGWVFHASATESRAAIADQPALMAPDARVRGVSPRMVAVINEAAARSMTFRRLVDQIGRTDGIVYVAEGQCGHPVRACLLHTLTLMGPNRGAQNPRRPAEGGSRFHGIHRARTAACARGAQPFRHQERQRDDAALQEGRLQGKPSL